MEARTGREKQVYDERNVRQVAGCVPVNSKTGQILLISSSKHDSQWVLPKGGWEIDETKEEAAARETYEEAGLRGQITRYLGTWDYHKPGKSAKGRLTCFWLYEMEVEEQLEQWPEMEERVRKWFSYDDAIAALATRPFMQEAIRLSTLTVPAATAPAVLAPAVPVPTVAVPVPTVAVPHHQVRLRRERPAWIRFGLQLLRVV